MHLGFWSKPQPYADMYDKMQSNIQAMSQGLRGTTLWFLEHEPIYTVGVRTQPQDRDGLPGDIKVVSTNRGGEATYHGPGQRVVYIMHDLQETFLSQFIAQVQTWVCRGLKRLGFQAVYQNRPLGVWVMQGGQEYKVASVGFRVWQGITYHGIALNVHNDMTPFQALRPCGLQPSVMGSLGQLGYTGGLYAVDEALIQTCPPDFF